MSLAATIKVAINAVQTNPVDLGTASFPLNVLQALGLSDGTGANQADRLFTDTRTLAASANEDLDLSGSLTNAFGTTVTFAKVKAVLVIADAGNTNNVNVTRPANGVPIFLASGDGVAVRPNGVFLLACADATAVAVTASTGDLINIANSAGSTSVTYTIIVIGTSA